MLPSLFPVRFDTLGCRLNQLETETIAGAFRAEGFPIIGSAENPDSCPPAYPGISDGQQTEGRHPVPRLCIINTCAVTAKAEQKARRLIRLLHKKFPGATILVTGCYAQTDPGKIEQINREFIVLPGMEKHRLKNLPARLRLFLEGGDPGQEGAARMVRDFCLESTGNGVPPQAGFFPAAGGREAFSFHSRASIKIQDGCSNRCSFCKTRIARGPSVSVPESEILSLAREIENAGWGEIVLTGINLHQYKGPQTGADLPDLIRMILDSTERIFIRISSLYPESVSEKFISVIKDERVCPFFHLSIQSGSRKIISLMRRVYSPERIENAISLLRQAKDEPFISCDIITGFPGETDEDFALTEKLCLESGFAHIHVFHFSPRPGTEAAAMKPFVPERISRERAERLEAISEEGKRRYLSLWQGKEIPAIWEYSGKTGRLRAHTINSLSLPLSLDENRDYPPETLELFKNNPEKLRGAQIIVKVGKAIGEPGKTEETMEASLVRILL